MSRAVLVVAVLVLGIIGGALVAITKLSPREPATAGSSPGPVTEDEAAQFDGYPLLWLGESFEGLALDGYSQSYR